MLHGEERGGDIYNTLGIPIPYELTQEEVESTAVVEGVAAVE